MSRTSEVFLAVVAACLLALVGGARAQTKMEAPPKAAPPHASTNVNPLIPRLSDMEGAGDHNLVSRLQKGGYVIFFRHAATDWGQRDVDYTNFENREGQRNLSETGKAMATDLGKAFHALAIPIDSVFASPMWRCRDTANLAFGSCVVRTALFGKVPVIQNGKTVNNPSEARGQYRTERIKMLSTVPTKGMNRILVGQQDPMLPIIPGLHRDELREGDALVVEPLGGEKFKVLYQVTPADWARLASPSASSKP